MRSWALGALWVVASIGAVSVAWAGVGVVNSEVIAPPPATVVPLVTEIASADVAADNIPIDEQASGTASSTTGSGSADSSTTSASTTSTTTTGQPSSTSQQSTSGGSTTTGGDSQPSSTTVPTTSTVPTTASTPTVTTTSTTVPTTSTTVPDCSNNTGPPAQTLPFTLTGGTASVSFWANGCVEATASANPDGDYKVTIETQTPGLKVVFRSDTHRSRLNAWWAGGPVWTIDEREL